MTTLGVMLSARAWRVADLPSYLVLVFAAVFVIVILAINPDSQDVQERRLEILASKPIAARTFALRADHPPPRARGPARGLSLAGCPWPSRSSISAWAWPRAVAAYLTLDGRGASRRAVLWLSVLMVSLRWIPLDPRAQDPSSSCSRSRSWGSTATSLGWIPNCIGQGGGAVLDRGLARRPCSPPRPGSR